MCMNIYERNKTIKHVHKISDGSMSDLNFYSSVTVI